MAANFGGVKSYFDKVFASNSHMSTFDKYTHTGRVVDMRLKTTNMARGHSVTSDMIDKLREDIKKMRETNAQQVVKSLDEMLKKKAEKDVFGNYQNKGLRDANSNIRVVTALLQKNDNNQRLTDLQVMKLSAGMYKLTQTQLGLMRKDPMYSNEGRLINAIKKQNLQDQLTNRNLNRLIEGKNTAGGGSWGGAGGALSKMAPSSNVRNLLYTMTGPLGPLLHSVDEIVSGIKIDREKMVEGLRNVGRVFERGFTAFTRFGGMFGRLLKGMGSMAGRGLSSAGGSIMNGLGGLGRGIGGFARSAMGKSLMVGGGALGMGASLYGSFNNAKDPNEGIGSKIGDYAGGAASGAMMGAALGPPGMIGGAVIGLLATYISRNWDQVKQWTAQAWEGAKGAFATGVQMFKDVWDQGTSKMKEWWDAISGSAPVKAVIGAAKAGAGAVIDAHKAVGRGAVNAGKAIAKFAGLGSLSAKYEGSAGSVAMDNNGSYAYGKYQFNAGAGGLSAFFKSSPEYAAQFQGMTPGSPEFNARWKALAATDPNFEKAQDKAGKEKFYDPVAGKAQSMGFNMNSMGVQEALYSGAINHSMRGNQKIMAAASATPGFASMDAKGQISAYYAARREYVKGAGIQGGPKVVDSLLKRYDREEKDALGVAEQTVGNMERQALSIGVPANPPNKDEAKKATPNATNNMSPSISDIPMYIDDLGLMLANTGMAG